MDVPAPPDDALAQPTRARLFRRLSELRRPAGTEELAEAVDLHPNGVRVHLEHLRTAGLVARDRTRQARGRPRDMWVIAPDARPGGEAPRGYADLGRWLARVISPGKTSLRGVEVTGREIGRELAPPGDCAAEEKLHATLASLGFAPRREIGPQGELTYRLCNCPYRDAVRESPDVVCALHRGITRGLLDVLTPKTRLAGFVARDPYRAGCLIVLRGPLAEEALSQHGEATSE
ncbi:MAG: helix-turn-helix domain-containing protein [Solirubrobacteraceae bacterium]